MRMVIFINEVHLAHLFCVTRKGNHPIFSGQKIPQLTILLIAFIPRKRMGEGCKNKKLLWRGAQFQMFRKGLRGLQFFAHTLCTHTFAVAFYV